MIVEKLYKGSHATGKMTPTKRIVLNKPHQIDNDSLWLVKLLESDINTNLVCCKSFPKALFL